MALKSEEFWVIRAQVACVICPWLAGRCFMADLLDAAEDDAGAEVPAAAG